ncbi:MAG: RagB/SusD family nutrient uptake outer membrane protein [Alloprevotella sp.]|nr:RagB/SusD family nutrient uptake outer membrane protein [Alloprevotella sp.]
MKKKTILGLFLMLGLGVSLSSCEDMLTPDLNRSAENYSGKDTVNFYLGILRNVQDMVEQNVLLGEIRGDIADTTMYTSDSIADIANFKRVPDGENELLNRAAYYKVINQCNFYLAKVDSLASKNNIFYMRKEAAQVMLVRAWTYLQLVQAYGRVPFITQPVSNANTGLEKNPEAWATADNLVDLLLPSVTQALAYEKAYGYPSYGTFNTGANEIPYAYMVFYGDLVLGDLYLLRGQSRSDYVEAAKYYYDFLNENSNIPLNGNAAKYITEGWQARYMKTTTTIGGNRQETFVPYATSWSQLYSASTPQTMYNEIFTMIPSSANTAFGRVMTRVAQVYGFDPHSTTQTTTDEVENTSGETETVIASSGRISVVANYKNRQLAPSSRFEALNKAQKYVYIKKDTEGAVEEMEYLDNGDARFYGTCPEVVTSDGRFRFVQKFCGSNVSSDRASVNSFQFRYMVGIYRLRQIMLRFAEALNRAGYPRHAFAVLRGGLNYERIPDLKETWEYDDAARTRKRVWEIDTIIDTQYHNNFINADEIRRAQADPNYSVMLDFSDERWASTCGIHELGCGNADVADTLNEYGVVVAERILAEQQRTGQVDESVRTLCRKLRASARGITVKDDDDPAEEETDEERLARERETYDIIEADPAAEADPLEIDAVESLIADECALETGFEGYRFYDLCRFARHKNNDQSGEFAANYGTDWLAWQVARRSVKLGLYENTNIYDRALYNALLDQQNWYLVNPEY